MAPLVRSLFETSVLLLLPGTSPDTSSTQPQASIGPVLALAVRGPHARSVWLDALGPADPVLARRTDPTSLCALYGG